MFTTSRRFLSALILATALLGAAFPLGHVAQAQGDTLQPVELRVMTFNIWLGGDTEDFGKVIESIQAAKADIVGLQELEGNGPRIAQALGWQHVNEQMHIISRYPLIAAPESENQYIYVQVRPGQVVAMANIHLPSDPYGPYLLRDGSSLEEVMQNERDTRMGSLETILAKLKPVIAAGMPLIMTGDFNAPSHRDWTAEVIAVRPERKSVVEWPVSLATEAAGFVDTYRAAHPDPVKRLGNTWTYGYPYPRLRENEMIDRIDFVYVAGKVETLSSEVVGPDGSPEVDFPIVNFPSDHRGVVSAVRVTPVIPPLYASPEQVRVVVGEPINVRYHAPEGEGKDRIAIMPFGGDPAKDILMWLPPQEADFFGSVSFGSDTLTPGKYAAAVLGADGKALSIAPFWVVARDAAPTVTTDKTTYKAGEAIVATWENAPALRYDWVGIYAKGDPDLYNNYLAFVYTSATVSGSATLDASVLGEEMLPTGEYEIRLMRDDAYHILAAASFKVE